MIFRLQNLPIFRRCILAQICPSVHSQKNVGALRTVSQLTAHGLITMNDNTRETLEQYLADIGANVPKIRKEVKFSDTNLCEKVRAVVDVLEVECDLDANEVGKMVTRRPRILLLDKDKVERCIEVLRGVGLEQKNISIMLKRSPGILTSRTEETLEKKMEVLYNLNVLPPFSVKDVLKIVTKCPALVSTCTPASLEDKVHFLLKDLGFYRRQLYNMILKQPSLLTFSQESIKEKFDYCYREIGVSIPDIARCPRIWQCSLKRLKERHLYLRHLNLVTNETYIDDFNLGKIVTPSDKVFSEQIAKTSLAEFHDFIKRIVKRKL